MGKNILTVELLLKSVEEWNAAREAYPNYWPNLNGEDLRGAQLCEANLCRTNFTEANLRGTNLHNANLNQAYLKWAKLDGANLSGANLICASFESANLSEANLSDAVLNSADLSRANLSNSNLSKAHLIGTNLSDAYLSNANLSSAIIGDADFSNATLDGADLFKAEIGYTKFIAVDLRNAIGLDTIRHSGPSTIGIDTIYASEGNIPEVFLRGCGVPDIFIEYVHSLTAKAFEYYSCFISHSTADKIFVDRLYADLQAKGVRCWNASHDMEGGEHVETQIDRAIKLHEKLLLVLSESSINSNWVKREITKAVNREESEGKLVLFPISLVDFSTLEEWEFVDSKGRDLAERIRKFYIPSFKGWENDNSLYTTEFDKLLKAFKDKSKQ